MKLPIYIYIYKANYRLKINHRFISFLYFELQSTFIAIAFYIAKYICRCLRRKLGRERKFGVEELGEGCGEESRDRDKERADAAPAPRRRHRGYPVAVDATGKQSNRQRWLLRSVSAPTLFRRWAKDGLNVSSAASDAMREWLDGFGRAFRRAWNTRDECLSRASGAATSHLDLHVSTHVSRTFTRSHPDAHLTMLDVKP